MKYLLSIGSNIHPSKHVPWVLNEMLTSFDSLCVGRFFYSPAIGMVSHRVFWNGAVFIESPLAPDALKELMCFWEITSGRDRSDSHSYLRDRTLDIDIIWCELYGWLESPEEIKYRPYLFYPISSLVRLKGKKYSVLKSVFFSFQGRVLGRRVIYLK